MTVTVKVDAQGRIVIPQAERERLGLRDGSTLELISLPEGVLLLERRRRTTVTVDDSGPPVVTLDEPETVTNVEAIEAIHDQRDDR